MKRNWLLGILVVLLGAGVTYFYINRKDPTTSIDRAESNFKIEDTGIIERIVLTKRNGVRSDLKRHEDGWILNDQYRARKSNVEFLLQGIERQSLDHIPNPAATKRILEYMATAGIHVEIFDKAGQSLLNYYIGGVTQDERGTFFLKDGSSQPYCLVEPGFEGSLRVRYAIEPIDWRDVRFWMEDLSKIDSMIVDYPQQRQHGFVISRYGSQYEVSPLYRTTPVLKNEKKGLIQSYFTTLQSLACEDYINEAPERDSVLRLQPFMTMQLVYPDHRAGLRFYPVGKAQTSEFSPAFNRYFIDYTGRDFMSGQYNVIKGAFRSYDYFFQQ